MKNHEALTAERTLPARTASSAELPDRIAIYDANGKLTGWRPNYAKPGIAEEVSRQAFYNECAARPPSSSLGLLIRLRQINRFEAEQRSKP